MWKHLASWTLALAAVLPLAGKDAAQAAPDAQAIDAQAPAAPAPAAKAADPKKKPAAGPKNPQPAAGNKSFTHVGWLTLQGQLREGPPPVAWAPAMEDANGTLLGVLKQLRTVAEDKRYGGVVIHLDGFAITGAQSHDLDRAIRQVRDKGKKVVFFAEAYDTRTYLLACAGDKILLQHKGGVELTGVAVEEMYLAGLFEKVGVKADFVQVGRFKGADEQLTRKGPSEFWSENFDKLMDDMYDQLLDRVATARRITRKQVETILADGVAWTDEQLVANRVVDALVTRDLMEPGNRKNDLTQNDDMFGAVKFEWDEHMGHREAGQNPMAGNPMMMFQAMLQAGPKPTTRPTLAVLHCSGPIQSGDSSEGGMFSGDSIGSRTLIELLRRCKDDANIKGVVLRIDSPGGSALASEMIWQSMREFQDEPPQKPLYVSIGGMAASGGYYMAVGAEQVYAAPTSIIGSIGVVGGKMTFAGLYDKLGIGIHRRSRGPMGDMFNSIEPFTLDQRAKIHESMKQVYKQFTDRVATGRGKRLKDVASVAEGRLFTGKQAVANGMADKIGGLPVALADLARHPDLNLREGTYDVIDLPEAPSLPEVLERFIGAKAPAAQLRLGADQAALLEAARRVMGAPRWQAASRTMSGLMLLEKERVLLLCPQPFVVR